MSRRILVIVALLALVAALMPVTSAQEEKVTLTFWWHAHPPVVPLNEDLVAQFMAENPNIEVIFEPIPIADHDLKLRTALAAGTGPDLFNQWTGEAGQFYASGVMAPLDWEAAGFESEQAVYDAYQDGEALLEGIKFDGRLYGLPTELSIYGCFTNDDLWEAAGLDPATDFPETWEEMREVAEQLTIRDGDVLVQRGFDFNWSSPLFMMDQFDPMVRQLGGMLIDDTDYSVHIDTPEMAKVLEYWDNWANEWNLGGPQYTNARDAFYAGELATDCSHGNWGIPVFEDSGINWSVHTAPTWEGAVNDNKMDLYAYFIMVNARSAPEVQEAAWKLAGFLMQHADRYLYEAGLFQPRKDLVDSEAFQSDEVMTFFLEEMSTSFYHPRIVGFFEVAEALARGRDRVVTGGEAIEDVLPELQAEVEEILQRARG